MNLSQIKLSDLKVIEGLLKRKEALVKELGQIEARLNSFVSGVAPRATKASPPRAARTVGKARKAGAKRRPPGELKQRILALLQQSGKAGISVREIASRLGLNPQRVFVWFNATGKRLKEIKKVAPATYTWNG